MLMPAKFQAQAVGYYITRVTLYQVHISSVSILSVSYSSFFLSFFLSFLSQEKIVQLQPHRKIFFNAMRCGWTMIYICAFSHCREAESSYHIMLGHITLAGGCGISLLLIRSISSITLPGGCCRSCSLFISKRFKRPRSAMVSLEQSHCGFFSDRSSCRWAVHLQTLKRPRTII